LHGTSSFNPSENVAPRSTDPVKPFLLATRTSRSARSSSSLRPKMAKVARRQTPICRRRRISRSRPADPHPVINTTLTSSRTRPILNHVRRSCAAAPSRQSVRSRALYPHPTSISPRSNLAVEVYRDNTASRLSFSSRCRRSTRRSTLLREREVATIYSFDEPSTKGPARCGGGFRTRSRRPVATLTLSVANGMAVPLSTVASFVNKVSPLTPSTIRACSRRDVCPSTSLRAVAPGYVGRADRQKSARAQLAFTGQLLFRHGTDLSRTLPSPRHDST